MELESVKCISKVADLLVSGSVDCSSRLVSTCCLALEDVVRSDGCKEESAEYRYAGVFCRKEQN